MQEALAQITWYANIALLEGLADADTRLWYARKCREHGWSHSILTLQIENALHGRQGKAITNFPSALPPADSDMASQVFKDPYLFDFLGTADPRREWQTTLVKALPKELKGSLPTVEELEQELSKGK